MDLIKIQNTLSTVYSIIEKYKLIAEKTGENFNIFEITEIFNKEVIICRVIYELINPQGRHSQKYKYLKLFVENVLNISNKFSKSDYENAHVFKEYIINNNRRIDLVITIGRYFIPIEVKIYASDQTKQCYDYYMYSKSHTKEAKVYYLTLDGHAPSEESTYKLTRIFDNENNIIGYKEIEIISFENDILNWLDLCIHDIQTIKITPILEILLQFSDIIKKLTNKLDGDEVVEIKDVLMQPDNIKSAIEIEKNLKSCKIEIMKKVFKAIDENLPNELRERRNKNAESDCDLLKNNPVEKFYTLSNRGTYPSLNYLFESKLNKYSNDENIELYIRIQVENTGEIICGICQLKNGIFDGIVYNRDDVIKDKHIHLLIDEIEKDIEEWIYYENLIDNDIDKTPNFVNFNDEYFKLFDEENFNKFIDKAVDTICRIANITRD